ncbi:ABC transporter substrate-binding protein [Thermococcus thermotolerans]|uniref:ABC transporter substrate-binding protein n=1 Tax=Thermococcus thermotolerans TaxID=2969672 RepID=UPI00215711AC|nr:ABC transporter substrate-binding protein [Thermococcus thermotolerans]
MRSAMALSLLLLVLLAPLAGAGEWSPVEVIKFQGVQNPEGVLRQIAKGEYDVGLFSLPADEYRRLDEDLLKNLELYKTVVSYNELTFNTYHDQDKDAPLVTVGDQVYFNPFAIREVRFAMNFLVSRDYIVQNIYQGSGAPMLGCIRPSHPANKYFEPVYSALNLSASQNVEYAMELFNEGMEMAVRQVAVYNHTLEEVNGTWYFDGKPVTIKFVIRIEDERQKIGRYVADLIEEYFGFKVERLEWDRQKAGQVVFATPPSEYEWNVYTGGWKVESGVPSVWIDDYTAWFYSAWYGYLPSKVEPKHRNIVTVGQFLRYVGNGDADEGLRVIRAEYYKSASELGEILNWTEEELTRLLVHFSLQVNGENYTIQSADQYWDLQKISMGLGIMEGVRIFLTEVWELSPVNGVRVSEIKADPNVGLFNRWSLLSAETPDGVLRVAHFVLTCCCFCLPFNPAVESEYHVFPIDIWDLLHDPAGYTDQNGLYTPYRCRWNVERGNFTVPNDAVIYNQTSGWITPHAGERAKVRVSVSCDLDEWQNGVRMGETDIKYYIAFLYIWAYKDIPNDPYYEDDLSETATLLGNVLGFEFTENGYVVYGNYAHPIADDLTAKDYVFYPKSPWELYYAMGELVANGDSYGVYERYSLGNAEGKIECLNLLTREHVADLRKVLVHLMEKRAIPPAIADDVSDPEEGYARLIGWIDTFHHAVVSDGSFYIEKNVPENLFMELRAFRGVSPIPSPATTPTMSQVSTSSSQSESPTPTNGSDDHQTATNTSLIYAIGLAGLLTLVLVLLMGWKR